MWFGNFFFQQKTIQFTQGCNSCYHLLLSLRTPRHKIANPRLLHPEFPTGLNYLARVHWYFKKDPEYISWIFFILLPPKVGNFVSQDAIDAVSCIETTFICDIGGPCLLDSIKIPFLSESSKFGLLLVPEKANDRMEPWKWQDLIRK